MTVPSVSKTKIFRTRHKRLGRIFSLLFPTHTINLIRSAGGWWGGRVFFFLIIHSVLVMSVKINRHDYGRVWKTIKLIQISVYRLNMFRKQVFRGPGLHPPPPPPKLAGSGLCTSSPPPPPQKKKKLDLGCALLLPPPPEITVMVD